MAHPWHHYFLFLAEVLTLVVAILILVGGILALIAKSKTPPGTLNICKVNDKLDEIKCILRSEACDKKTLKKLKKADKCAAKAAEKKAEPRKRAFLLNFNGDIKASQTCQLREEITAILQVATPEDEIIVKLESPGGMVSGYGLAASQLARLKDRKIPLTVCIDKIAASGGYMMAAVADQIIAAPFAIIGSIGVVAQVPNFHRLLKKHDIDFEQITAGKYKRTLTLFGENTREGREKMQQDIEEIQIAFKGHIAQYRPNIDIDKVATGEHWLAVDAEKLYLVDRLMTSDDYVLYLSQHADIFELCYQTKKSLLQKIQSGTQTLWNWAMGIGA